MLPKNDNDQPDQYHQDVVFRTDLSGNGIAIRPKTVLIDASGGLNPIFTVVAQIAAEIDGRKRDPGKEQSLVREGQAIVSIGEQVRGDWFVFDLQAPIDVLRLVRGLRDRGIRAQPNHTYFVNSLPKTMAGYFNPNLFAPNLFAPNLFAGSGANTSCCCSLGLSTEEPRIIPKLAARPAEAPGLGAAPVGNRDVEIYLVDVASPVDQDDELHPGLIDANHDGWADPAMGHGDFVKSIIEWNSGLTATLAGQAGSLGAIDDAALVMALRKIDDRADENAKRILNLSLSGYNEDDRPGTILADQIAAMIAKEWLIVASAGNNSSCRLAWPAALPEVIAVGAMDNCQPAWFSNFGPWVDASAPGVDIVAEYPDLSDVEDIKVALDDKCMMLDADDFDTGWASWSGTSFSAPLVTARLALRLHQGDTNEQAVEAVITDPDLPRLLHYGTMVR
ncbi:MAG: S8 family serine peptidase [Actinomycetia bacterium]|nr:S8 family serine peptidase [Actinomycetes bacterium]